MVANSDYQIPAIVNLDRETRLLLQSIRDLLFSAVETLYCLRPKHFYRESRVISAYFLEGAIHAPKESLDVEHDYADRFLSHA